MNRRAVVFASASLLLALAPALRAEGPDPTPLVEGVAVARAAARDLERLMCAHVRAVHGVGEVREVDDLVVRVETAVRQLRRTSSVDERVGTQLERVAEALGRTLHSPAWWERVRALPAPEVPGSMRDPRVDEVAGAVGPIVEPLREATIRLLHAIEAADCTSAELARPLWDVEDATDDLRTCLFLGLLGPGADPMLPADRLDRFNGEVLLRLAEHRAATDLPDGAREAIGKVANRAMLLHKAFDDGRRSARAGGPPLGDLLPALDARWRALDEMVTALAAALPADLVRPRRRTPEEQRAARAAEAREARDAARAWVLAVQEHAWAVAAVRVGGEAHGLLGACAAGIDGGLDRLGSPNLVAQLPPPAAERLTACSRRWEALRGATLAAPGATPEERLAELERAVADLDALLDDARAVLAAWDELARARGLAARPAQPELEQTQDALGDLRAHALGALVGSDAHARRVADARPRLAESLGQLIDATPEWALPLVEELPGAHAALEAVLDGARGAPRVESSPAIDEVSRALAELERVLYDVAAALDDARR